MAKQSNIQFAKALYEVTEHAPQSALPEIVKQFLLVLQKNNRLKKINYILDEFIAYSKKQSGITTVELETAQSISDQIIQQIKKKFGNTVEIEHAINPKLLGGIKIKIEDSVYDASVQTQLNKLKKTLQA